MKKTIIILVLTIVLFSAIASFNGVYNKSGHGEYEYQSIRGETVKIYGQGLYKHMSKEVAIQGIAQDYITFSIAIPLLILSLFMYIKNSLRFKLLLGGVLFYVFVTYLLYLAMGMYNEMFLVYIVILGSSFFALITYLLSLDYDKINSQFSKQTPMKSSGIFLIINSLIIALLWLSIIISPLVSGKLYPQGLEHYTTLIVQGFNLGLLLPMAFITGYLMIKKHRFAYVFGSVYLTFLSILMTALTAKIIAMKIGGYSVVPVIFIIPTINIVSIIFNTWVLSQVRTK